MFGASMSMRNRRPSRNTLAQAGLFVGASTLALTASFLGVVGLLTSQLIFYILAAGLIGTGVCYWALRNRSELARASSDLG